MFDPQSPTRTHHPLLDPAPHLMPPTHIHTKESLSHRNSWAPESSLKRFSFFSFQLGNWVKSSLFISVLVFLLIVSFFSSSFFLFFFFYFFFFFFFSSSSLSSSSSSFSPSSFSSLTYTDFIFPSPFICFLLFGPRPWRGWWPMLSYRGIFSSFFVCPPTQTPASRPKSQSWSPNPSLKA